MFFVAPFLLFVQEIKTNKKLNFSLCLRTIAYSNSEKLLVFNTVFLANGITFENDRRICCRIWIIFVLHRWYRNFIQKIWEGKTKYICFKISKSYHIGIFKTRSQHGLKDLSYIMRIPSSNMKHYAMFGSGFVHLFSPPYCVILFAVYQIYLSSCFIKDW